ncbi:putative Dolichyl-phosphate-mannose-protein mannosyltransferase [Handroanthus impetiginosus]|uniref:GPI mannosyltransferase 2 n=1 Tax=Handroanthus impetiginosus TaxID=429701 RepID=A0A2G9H2K8_9LAMI|nr:putative Dolichyl-phosphate-mannose-protein mannosyltransferase [Handroanthus impetiginosus]
MTLESVAVGRCTNTHRLVQYAVASRLLILILIVIWRSLLSPYDTSAAINPPCLSSSSDPSNSDAGPVLFPKVGSAIETSIVWDGVYFTRIAECRYEYEQTYAFLPLLPLCISVLSRTVFAPLVPVIGYRAVLGLSGYVLNNIAFVFAALYLYRLSLIVLKDSEVSLRASILFCFNPASIFYSSIYSESLYALLSFGGLYYFMNGADCYATFWFALSGCARSNGVLNAGYICFRTMQQVNEAFLSGKRTCLLMVKIVLAGALRSLCILTPFISFQAYGYLNICLDHSVAEMRPWCRARLPLLYNYIQSHYWGVGFLRYFQVKQLPNFLLASPILSLALCSIVYYVKLWPEVFLSLGLRASSTEKELVGSGLSAGADGQPSTVSFSEDRTRSILQDDGTPRLRKRAIKGEHLVTQPSEREEPGSLQYDPAVILPFVLHLSFMVATAFFVMHVQVATRFLSSSPFLYWFAAHIMGSPGIGKRWGHFIWAYCAAYVFLGSLLFSNFYPFT